MALAGLIKLDSPTVQRLGLMVFLQAVLNLRWTATWRKGDISSAFLQGKARDVDRLGRLYLEPPKRPLEGVQEGCLLEVAKSVYGLPDAPRAWFEELTGYLVEHLGFRHSRLDVAFLTWYHKEGVLRIMLTLHVDDLMIAGDGSPSTEATIEKLRERIPPW